MSKQSYSERFKIISEKEACFEEAFVLLFEAIDEVVGYLREQKYPNEKYEDIEPNKIITTTGGTA